jgi:hypothetical protein
MLSKNLNASVVKAVWRVSLGKLSITFLFVMSIAFAELSTESTFSAPPLKL